jgi:hypothetical protein
MNIPTAEWSAHYWQPDKHGASWANVKAALQRDWEQTCSDFGAGGKDLNQKASDTLKQASGSVALPLRDEVNPPDLRAWDQIEPAVRYGYGAHQQYGGEFAKWDDALERKLASEWDEGKTGEAFGSVRGLVRRGWNGPLA